MASANFQLMAKLQVDGRLTARPPRVHAPSTRVLPMARGHFLSRAHAATTPSALLAELRAFASQRRRPTWPNSLSSTDADAVAAGAKTLVSPGSPLQFSCTACGVCCRSLSSTVLVDAADLWRITRGGVPLNQTNFSRAVGLFSFDALNSRAESAAEDALRRFGYSKTRLKSGTAPVLFLKPRATVKNAGPTCGYLVTRGSGETAHFECGLGIDGMPLSCALYPLGHFMRAEESGVDFFTVDAGKCEGVGGQVDSTGIAYDKSVDDFFSRNSLADRLAAADKFRGLVTAYAVTGIELATTGPPRARDALASDSRARLPRWIREALAARAHEDAISRGPASDVPALLVILRDRARAIWEAPREIAAAVGVDNALYGDWSDSAADALLTATAELMEEWTTSVLNKTDG